VLEDGEEAGEVENGGDRNLFAESIVQELHIGRGLRLR
jgi:hypothetical protein